MQNKDGYLSGFHVSGLRQVGGLRPRSKSDPSQPTAQPASVAFKPPRSVKTIEGQVNHQVQTSHAKSEVQGFRAIDEDVKAYFENIPTETLNSHRQDPAEHLFKTAADLLHHVSKPGEHFHHVDKVLVNQPLRSIQPSMQPFHLSLSAGHAAHWNTCQNLPLPSSSHSEYRLSSSQPHDPSSCHNGAFSVGMSSLSQPGKGGGHGWGLMPSELGGRQSSGGRPTVDRAENSLGAMHPLGVQSGTMPDITRHHQQYPPIIGFQKTEACTAFPGSFMPPSPGNVPWISASTVHPHPICSESLRPSNRGTSPERHERGGRAPVGDEVPSGSKALLIHMGPPAAAASTTQSVVAMAHDTTRQEHMQEAKQPPPPIQANKPQALPAALPSHSEVYVKVTTKTPCYAYIIHATGSFFVRMRTREYGS